MVFHQSNKTISKLQVEEQQRRIDELEQTSRIQVSKIAEQRVALKARKTRIAELLNQNKDIIENKIEAEIGKIKDKYEKSKKRNSSLEIALKESQKQTRDAKFENAAIKDNIAKIISDAKKIAIKKAQL